MEEIRDLETTVRRNLKFPVKVCGRTKTDCVSGEGSEFRDTCRSLRGMKDTGRTPKRNVDYLAYTFCSTEKTLESS
jgi:hypothetical protein